MKIPVASTYSSGSRKFEVILHAVWGQMVTGGGASHLGEVCATLGMPGLTQAAFCELENEIGNWWKLVS